jgi:hypothetical protein
MVTHFAFTILACSMIVCQAYKEIESIVDDLVSAGLITVVAVMRPVITYKTRQ